MAEDGDPGGIATGEASPSDPPGSLRQVGPRRLPVRPKPTFAPPSKEKEMERSPTETELTALIDVLHRLQPDD